VKFENLIIVREFNFLLYLFFFIFILGVFSEAGSKFFIIGLPIFYYIFSRFVEPLLTFKKSLSLSAIIIFISVIIVLPPTRKAIASYYLKIAGEGIYSKNTLEIQKELASAARWYPNHPELLYQRYLAAQVKGDLSKARVLLAKAVSAGHNDIDSIYTLARLYSQARETEKEIPLYEQILKIEPNHPEANYCLAMYYDQKQHNKEKAIYHLKIARDNLPADNEWRKRCEEIFSQLGAK